MKQHENYMSSLAQASKNKCEFIVAGLAAKIPMAELTTQATSLFEAPAPPPPFPSQMLQRPP